MDCKYCAPGFEAPRGYVTEYKWTANVRQVRIDHKEINETKEGRDVEYRSDRYVLSDGLLFNTKEEAQAKVEEFIRQHEIEEKRRIDSLKDNDKKSYSWHVGYHRNLAKKAHRELDYHEAKVISMGVRAKEVGHRK